MLFGSIKPRADKGCAGRPRQSGTGGRPTASLSAAFARLAGEPVPTPARRSVDALVDRLTGVPGREDRLRHLEVLPAREAVHEPTGRAWVPDDVRGRLRGRRGRPGRGSTRSSPPTPPTPATTWSSRPAPRRASRWPTSCRRSPRSGPRAGRAASAAPPCSTSPPPRRWRTTSWPACGSLRLDVRLSAHDGDSSREERDWTRDHGEYVLTNPDMLHRSLLPAHAPLVAPASRSLQYVVVDECHHYRGVFGAHVSHVLRRLRRVCAMYGAHPTFVLASATVADPEVTAARLTGLDVVALTRDDSPRGRVSLLLWEPPFTSHAGRERRARAPRRVLGGRRPARRPGRRGRAHPGLHPVATRCRAGRALRRRPAGGGRPVAAGAGRGLPRRLPARGAPRPRGGPAPRRPHRARGHQRPRARDRHQRPRRGPHRGLPRHPRRLLAAGGPGRAWRAGRARRARRQATTRSTPTSSRTPRR